MKLSILSFLLLSSILTVAAQFPYLQWEYSVGAPSFGSPAAADMDNDGFYEIVFTTYTNDGRAHCLNAEDGTVKWIFDIGGCGDVAPIIHDMNGDGQLDVVINGSCNPTIFCINGATGELLWSKPSGGGDSPPTIADIDKDDRPEVLFGNFNGEIRILNGEDGSLAKSIQVIPEQRALQSEPTLVDVDGDGDLDILAASYFNFTGMYVWAFDYDSGAIIWENHRPDTEPEFHAYHGGAVGDIDNDGLMEYVIGSWGGFIYALNVEDGSELWSIDVPVNNFMAITIADLNDDDQLEVIFSNNDYQTFNDRIWVVSGLDGSEQWSYPVNFSAFRGVSISDINGNGQLDLVSGHFMGRLRVLEPYNGLIWELDLREYFSNGDQFPYFETDSQPLIADFDQNGTVDIFAVAGYGTYFPDSLNAGKAFMFEAGKGICPEWLMFRQNIRRTGYFSREAVAESCAATTSIEDEDPAMGALSVRMAPNPVNKTLALSYELQRAAHVEVQIVDELGREIVSLYSDFQLAGAQALTLHRGSSIPAGLYFLELRLNGRLSYVDKLVFM